MVKEVPFLNGNLSIYSCFIDVLYDLRRILALAFTLMSSAAFKSLKWSTIQLVLRELIAFKDKLMGFRINFFNK